MIEKQAYLFQQNCLHISRIGVGGMNYTTYTFDKLHPKEVMMKMIANQCYSEMMASSCI